MPSSYRQGLLLWGQCRHLVHPHACRLLLLVHLFIQFAPSLSPSQEENGPGDGEYPSAIEDDRAVHVLWWVRRGRGTEGILHCKGRNREENQ